MLTALVRHGQLFTCLRRLLRASRQSAVDPAGDTHMAETAERPSSRAAALDTLVSTLTARAASSSAGTHTHDPWVYPEHHRSECICPFAFFA